MNFLEFFVFKLKGGYYFQKMINFLQTSGCARSQLLCWTLNGYQKSHKKVLFFIKKTINGQSLGEIWWIWFKDMKFCWKNQIYWFFKCWNWQKAEKVDCWVKRDIFYKKEPTTWHISATRAQVVSSQHSRGSDSLLLKSWG